jgi:adenylate cyclase class 2
MILAGLRFGCMRGGVAGERSGMMVEVEMKFPVSDFSALERRLGEWGGVATSTRKEADHYFNAPDRDFARTDEAFRLRRIGIANFITYKGPKQDPQTKTRFEVEVPLGAGDAVARDFVRLLEQLGYRSVAVVRKERRTYHVVRDGFSMEVCMDEVEGLGRFAELEIRASEQQVESARQTLMRSASALGLDGSERRSYLELFLSRRTEAT